MKKEVKAEQAHYLKDQILRIKASMGQGYFLLGELLKKFRDDKLYRLQDYQTMGEWIAQPELALSRTSVYDYIHMHEMYELKLGIDPKDIADVVYSQLRKILPVVEKSPSEWIEKARTLTRSDLTIEVRESQGHVEEWKSPPNIEITPSEALESILSKKRRKDTPATKIYVEIVSQCEICPICDKVEDLTPHHFPRTKARGGKDGDWKRIPLCLECHEEAEAHPSEWLMGNRVRMFDWFYGVIEMLIERLGVE